MEPLAIITTITVAGVVTKAVVEAVRRQYPQLDGLLVQFLAWALGGGIAWALDIQGTEALLTYFGATAGRVPVTPVDYIITGAAIAAGAGVIAELSGKAKTPPAVVEVNASGERM